MPSVLRFLFPSLRINDGFLERVLYTIFILLTGLTNWSIAISYLSKHDLLRHTAILKSNHMSAPSEAVFQDMDSKLGMPDLSRSTVSRV